MPKILEIKKGSYYKEQYINKKLFKTEPEKWEKYKKLIYQSFDDLHLKKMNEKMDSYVYSDALVRDIESQLKHFAHLSNEVEKIKEMMDFVKKSITDQKIYINYSHGDAWVGNIIRNKKSISLIDWHDFGNRSIFFDHITSIYSVVKINTQNKQWNGTGSRSIDKELNQLSNIYSIPIEKIKVYHFLFMLELIISRLKYKDEIGDEALKIAFDWTEKFKQVLKGECQI
ncbi:hypothetical protein JMA_33830 [Jeotgalibacillus malaysiensis]|uniref:Aminoglycoside phosphotransferase domain-containing protein n=1 Tax=Jeotgalibacillus malaysiensis TaxID=1508404 RepID=A0A0B5AR41_9BACL|nr:hypothetical protein JMA_33830 [Jeotgalibacillus malaysiensis]